MMCFMTTVKVTQREGQSQVYAERSDAFNNDN